MITPAKRVLVEWVGAAALTLTLMGAGSARAQTQPPPRQFEEPSTMPPPADTTAQTAAVAAPVPAPAPADEDAGAGLLVGLKVGGLFPQPFSDLGAALAPELELGYFVLEKRVAVFLDLGYAQPKASGTVTDPRVPGGAYEWTLTQRDLTTSLGVMYRFVGVTPVIPYAGIAFRLHLQESIADGTAGADVAIGESRETRTKAGGVLLGGGELPLGPGYLLGEVELGYAGLDNRITGDANMGGIALRLGYRIFF